MNSVTKTCNHCRQIKPLEEFYKRIDRRGGEGRRSICKLCNKKDRYRFSRTYNKDWYAKQLLKDPLFSRRKNLLRTHNITLKQFDTILDSQGGVCAICKGPPMGKGNYHVDHGHSTGKLRGLLCHKCNVALGMVQDRIELLEALIAYVKKNRSTINGSSL
jgi:hypothetical protein